MSTPTKQDSIVNALLTTNERHQANLDRLEKSMKLTQRELALLRAEISNDLERRFMFAYIFGTILIIIGLSSVASIWVRLKKAENSISDTLNESMRRRVSVQIAERIEGIDPTSVPVHYPQGVDRELERLGRFGFGNLIYYEKLDGKCTEGVVIIRLGSDNGLNCPEVSEFKQFVKTYVLKNSSKVGFMFYNTSKKPFPREIFDLHHIIDYSSSATTLSSNIMTVARNLDRFWDASGTRLKSADFG